MDLHDFHSTYEASIAVLLNHPSFLYSNGAFTEGESSVWLTFSWNSY
jgi:hypothetical protein